MMRNLCNAALLMGLCVGSLCAYNPPVGGESLFVFPNAETLVGGASSAGSGFYNPAVGSTVSNPALLAPMQRVALGVAGAVVTPGDGGDGGGGGELGLALPSRWGVFAGLAQFLAGPYGLGNTFSLRGTYARDLTDRLYIGGSLLGGINGPSTNAAFAADLGFLYRIGPLGSLSAVRIGGVVQNLGVTFGNGGGSFPGPWTPKVGIAAVFFDIEGVSGAFSLDAALPSFQNLLLDGGLQLKAGPITLSAAIRCNVREEGKGFHSLIPAVGLTFRHSIKTSGVPWSDVSRSETRRAAIKTIFSSGPGEKKGFEQSDVGITGGWKGLPHGSNLVSAALGVNFGERDTAAPEISVWGER
jgi:hypothetical protein